MGAKRNSWSSLIIEVKFAPGIKNIICFYSYIDVCKVLLYSESCEQNPQKFNVVLFCNVNVWKRTPQYKHLVLVIFNLTILHHILKDAGSTKSQPFFTGIENIYDFDDAISLK